MNYAILAVSNWLHLLATVVWIGGIVLILMVVLPGAKEALEQPVVGKLMEAITKRFTPLANTSIVVIVLTGLALAFFDKNLLGSGKFSSTWSLVVIGKHLIVAPMIVIHFYRSLVLSPKIKRLSVEQAGSYAGKLSPNLPKLQRLSLNLIWVNLSLGILVLLLSGMAAAI